MGHGGWEEMRSVVKICGVWGIKLNVWGKGTSYF